MCIRDSEKNPDKQWKITEEDWRNREKWDQYEEAVNEMLIRTSTEKAPWIVVEGNCKYYARIKVLETVVNAVSYTHLDVYKRQHCNCCWISRRFILQKKALFCKARKRMGRAGMFLLWRT